MKSLQKSSYKDKHRYNQRLQIENLQKSQIHQNQTQKSPQVEREEGDAKQLYLVFKVSFRRTDNLQPGTLIIKNLQYNGILNMASFMQSSLSQFSKFNQWKGSLPSAI